MKINSVSVNHYINSYCANKPCAPEKGKITEGTDRVTFSEEAMRYTKSLSGIKDLIEVRSNEEKGRIAELKKQIEQGRYKIDSDQVADKILDAFGSKARKAGSL